MKKFLKATALTLCVFLCIISFLPLGYGIINMGVILPFCFGLFTIIFISRRNNFLKKNKKIWRIFDKVVILLLVLGILFFAVVSCLMTYGVHRYKQANDQTVVVLGCKVNGEIPSRMLTRRLETAYELLVNNPELKCVVTGGQGEDEVCTEASVMQKFLAEKGIAQERIFFEDQAINTKENFQKTAEIIDKNHLNTSIIIVTDFFHQYRSQFYANKFALESTSVSCSTQPDLFLCYWVREVLAVAKAFVGM